MGNSNSQSLHHIHHHHQSQGQQWAHSYPRDPQRARITAPQNKVLPERIPGQRLRVTDNGAILHNGGTISGRRQSPGRYSDEEQPNERYRSRSSSNNRQAPQPRQSGVGKFNGKRFGSEPDLRNPNPHNDSPAKQRITRTRKKYKAPTAPPPEGDSHGLDSSSPDSYHWENLDPPTRRLRLFKTREETKKILVPRAATHRSSSPEQRRGAERSGRERERSVPRERSNNREQKRNAPNGMEQDRSIPKGKEHNRIVLNVREHERNVINGKNVPNTRMNGNDNIRSMPDHGIRVKVEKRLIESPTIPRVNGLRHTTHLPPTKTVPRNLSTPEFQAELIHAAQRLRPTVHPAPEKHREVKSGRGERKGPIGEAAEPRSRGDGSGRESTPEPIISRRKQELRHENKKSLVNHWEIIQSAVHLSTDRDVPTKTFYFGMEQGECDAVDKFAASIHLPPAAPTTSGSAGSLSSDIEDELDGSIALQLRPMLPKKQLEIPRFSPTAAWRLLSALDSPTALSIDEPPVLLEERIQRLSRPMAPPLPQILQAPRSSHDKSGDSGISGDASPGGCNEDSSEAPLASPPIRKPSIHSQRALATAWTPQQDLGEEESSSDGGVVDDSVQILGVQPKFSPRAQVFSLSLPRDERLCLALYSENTKSKRDVPPSFNSLKKLKRSVSGAFTALNIPTKMKDEDKAQLLDENWLLSRSVANLLNGTYTKPSSNTSTPSSPDHDLSQRTSFSYLASGGHVMYLPEYKSQPEPVPERSYGGLQVTGMLSKSCENISANEMRQLDRTPSPNTMDVRRGFNGLDNYPDMENATAKDLPMGKRGKNRRFTFQSTVRQIERRRISERLSREAELKERRRLGELEAMRRVEEEFQRKRAPEKANIRHQLRLFNLDEQLFSSLPNGWSDTNARAEPDGATSSSPSPNAGSSPPPSTQILSEFREPRRDYRDYRPARYVELGPESLPEKRSTIHPPVVFDMPKSTQVYVAPHRQPNVGPIIEVDRGGMSTPRSSSSDNYRRDFAHGALRSLASSDSELSQPNTRPTSRQRSRSPSPAPGRRSKSAEPCSSSEDELLSTPETTQVLSAAKTRISLTSVQPFVLHGKGYRPIAFSLGTKPAHNVAQPVN